MKKDICSQPGHPRGSKATAQEKMKALSTSKMRKKTATR